MGGHEGGAGRRGHPRPGGRRVGRRAPGLRGRLGSGYSAGLHARIPTSMAVEEEGLRVFQSVKIKIGGCPGAGGGSGVFAGLTAGASRSPEPLLEMSAPRLRSLPHLPGTAGPLVASPPHLLVTAGQLAASPPPPQGPAGPPTTAPPHLSQSSVTGPSRSWRLRETQLPAPSLRRKRPQVPGGAVSEVGSPVWREWCVAGRGVPSPLGVCA